jgi:hypothetical protein
VNETGYDQEWLVGLDFEEHIVTHLKVLQLYFSEEAGKRSESGQLAIPAQIQSDTYRLRVWGVTSISIYSVDLSVKNIFVISVENKHTNKRVL